MLTYWKSSDKTFAPNIFWASLFNLLKFYVMFIVQVGTKTKNHVNNFIY